MSLARNVATSATLKTIAQDAAAGQSHILDETTISSYLEEFRRNYFVEELGGWDAPIRSKSRVRTKPKRYFADPSLVPALLGCGTDALLRDGQLLGLAFENLAFHELGVYARMLPGYMRQSLRYYSDADGLEVDFIIELSDGRWAGIECKLGEAKVPEGISNLNRLRRKIAANPAARNREPEFMAVLLGKGAIARYDAQSDVYIIPIDVLEP